MVQIVHALLVLPDGRVVFQRRDKKPKVGPGLLSFFGGHLEARETPMEAVKRELKEETSLDVGTLDIKHLSSRIFSGGSLNMPDDREIHLFKIAIPSAEFKIYEGERTEVYSKAEALARDDLFQSVRYELENYKEE